MHAARSKKLGVYSAIIKFRSVNESIFKKNEAQASLLTLIFWPPCHTLASFFLNQAYTREGPVRCLLKGRNEWSCKMWTSPPPPPIFKWNNPYTELVNRIGIQLGQDGGLEIITYNSLIV